MALIRWQPFHEMESLQRDMNRMFETLATEQGSMRQSFMPLAEMEQTDDAIHLKVEVPGMNAEDLDVQVTREAVMITGERKSKSKSEKNGMTRSEFRYGRFNRTIPLPMPVDNNKVKGDYQDGILTLELPKLQKEEDKVTKVNIGSSSNKSISESQSQQESTQSATANNQNENSGYGNQDAWQDSESSSSQAQSTAS